MAPAANGNTVGVTYTNILALRLDRFTHFAHSELTSNFTMASTTATNVASLSTADTNQYLFLGGWYTSSTTTNNNIETAVNSVSGSATTHAISIRRSYGTSATLHNTNIAFATANNATSWTTTVRNATGNNNATVGSGSAWTILNLDGTVVIDVIDASLNQTDAADVSTSSAKLSLSGNLSGNESNDSVSSISKVAISGSTSSIETDDTLTSTGKFVTIASCIS